MRLVRQISICWTRRVPPQDWSCKICHHVENRFYIEATVSSKCHQNLYQDIHPLEAENREYNFFVSRIFFVFRVYISFAVSSFQCFQIFIYSPLMCRFSVPFALYLQSHYGTNETKFFYCTLNALYTFS
ncbi:hypothetical protein B4U80_02056 [Leptotrombidium deliense]|uniref:Uncharacterized protein n=1 Tax=Leptotrombidium deliense TaxID=299467 RepID=A0A443STW5_9ACAR|nr:hypothetical protein B4U80_02056 [Leptotrombidium deliense]